MHVLDPFISFCVETSKDDQEGKLVIQM
ncbi:hypothetical protein Ccrd_022349 [Cynara cardunculus var. scolymus]|uniref:Uncharacterized protein n=1 Tax=Cynara cardunculus var. scolymus TaxID=59895 RepID=A0A118JZA8_CYNCS|nr:hypothetical protein Ccrd_022349 [Cynara cardunculus var. scolymus]